MDGRKYWIKSIGQQGLLPELVAGRLAKLTGSGPDAQVISVSAQAAQGSLSRLQGLCVGILDIPSSVNLRDIPAQTLEPSKVNLLRLALVFAFQTWIGVGDTQGLIRMTDGHFFTLDHGDCFSDSAISNVLPHAPVFIPEAAHLYPHIKTRTALEPAITRIEQVTDRQILESVARVPSGPAWKSDPDRRLRVGQWLQSRRASLRGTLEQWSAS